MPMNPKFKTLEWWSIVTWIPVFGLWMLPIVLGIYLNWINIWLMALGIWFMCYCAINEEKWFPDIKPLKGQLTASECEHCGSWVERISNNDYCPRCARRLAILPIFPQGDYPERYEDFERIRKCSTACSHFDLINQCCWIVSDAGLCTDAREGDLCRYGFKVDSNE